MYYDHIILSRLQMALTLSFHIIFPALTIGLSAYLLYWETKWLRTGNVIYYNLCKLISKIFAMAFGMGVVSGIVLSYEFGTNFSKFSIVTGNIIGPLLSYEVLTAFFLEAGFLGVMIFGWNRVSKPIHLFSTLMVTIGTVISAFWIISANSWMHTPTGYYIKDGIFYVKNWLDIILNPSFPYRFMHMIIASYLSSTFFLIGIASWYVYKNKYNNITEIIYPSCLKIALVLSLTQVIIGDLHGLNSFKHQPLKIAAMEGHWENKKPAPFVLFAIPDQENEKNDYELSIPKIGSLIITHDLTGEILGLKSVPKEDRPNMMIVFYSFRIMVAIGIWFVLTSITGVYLSWKDRLFEADWFHKFCIISAPLGFIAIIAGWYTTETARQPWVVYNLLRTKDVISDLSSGTVMTSMVLLVLTYVTLLTAFLYYLFKIIKKGPEKITLSEQTQNITSWFEED